MNALPSLFIAGLAAGIRLTAAAPEFVPVRKVGVAPTYRAYAEVEPIALLPVRSAVAGVVVGRGALPGSSVVEGQPLAALGGPEVDALRAEYVAAVRSAREAAAAADRKLAVAKSEQPSHLTTEQDVLQAEADAAAARGRLESAEGRRRALDRLLTLTAPATGTVVQVNAADGERVAAGEPVFTLQPDAGLWLQASYYGSDAGEIHVGMAGQFTPAGGGASGAVKVVSVGSSRAPDGGETVGLVAATGRLIWSSGTYGTVELRGPAREATVVPTEALILDRGRWWVLVRTPKGFRRQEVEPGPAQGWNTVVERGLHAGEEVATANAYLEFHAAIASRYQPPD